MADSDCYAKIVDWLKQVHFAAKVSNWNVATLAAVISTRIAPKYKSFILNAPLSKPDPKNPTSRVPVTSEEYLTNLSRIFRK
jgi:hypothetical protein